MPGGTGPRAAATETASQTLHRLTSYDAQWYETHRSMADADWLPPVTDPRVVDMRTNDEASFPWFYKRYAEPLPRLPLPRTLPPAAAPAVAVLAGPAHIAPGDLDLPGLSRLLYLSAGVVRTMERPTRTWLFRAAGSAGGRFPLELYAAIPAGTGLPAGVHWYDPHEHALVQIGPAPRAGAPSIVVTGVPWRTGWRYRERGYRHVYWDAGTMLAQTLAAATSAGIAARLYTGFPDAPVAALVGADGVHELPVAVVALGDGAPAIEPAGQRSRAWSTRHPWSSLLSPPRSGQGTRMSSGLPGRAPHQRSRQRDRQPPWRRRCSGAEVSAAWTRLVPCLAACCAPACMQRCGELTCGTTLPSIRSTDPRLVCTAGRTCRPRSAQAICATRCIGCASSRHSAATRRSS